ncbi:MAG: glucose 1-dehydrogenase [Bryobacteraceae bacterium]|jgi:threonine dehydrogenase-like Zn-dependent dehydrogenase
MKAAAVYPGKKELGLVPDFPEPQIESPTGVKLRILNVGVCGTDREIASFLYGTPPDGSDYLVIGHESIGEVVEVGPEVEHFKPGDIAVPMVRRPCHYPECYACRAGRQDFCCTGDYRERGIMKMHGFMTERVVDDAVYMNAVPRAICDVAVLVEPLTIAEKALLQVLEVQKRFTFSTPPGNAVVLGAGPVGLLGAMTLALHGYEVTVYSREREPNPSAEIVKAIGARYISSQDLTIPQMAGQTGNIDLVYEATGVSRFAIDVLHVLGHNGVFILTGVPGHHGPTPTDTDAIMRDMVLKNQSMVGTVNAGKDAFEKAVADLTRAWVRWPAAVNGLITGRFSIEQFTEPIRRQTGIKNIIEIGK